MTPYAQQIADMERKLAEAHAEARAQYQATERLSAALDAKYIEANEAAVSHAMRVAALEAERDSLRAQLAEARTHAELLCEALDAARADLHDHECSHAHVPLCVRLTAAIRSTPEGAAAELVALRALETHARTMAALGEGSVYYVRLRQALTALDAAAPREVAAMGSNRRCPPSKRILELEERARVAEERAAKERAEREHAARDHQAYFEKAEAENDRLTAERRDLAARIRALPDWLNVHGVIERETAAKLVEAAAGSPAPQEEVMQPDPNVRDVPSGTVQSAHGPSVAPPSGSPAPGGERCGVRGESFAEAMAECERLRGELVAAADALDRSAVGFGGNASVWGREAIEARDRARAAAKAGKGAAAACEAGTSTGPSPASSLPPPSLDVRAALREAREWILRAKHVGGALITGTRVTPVLDTITVLAAIDRALAGLDASGEAQRGD